MDKFISDLDKNQSFKDDAEIAHRERSSDFAPASFPMRDQTTFIKDEEYDEFKHNRLIQSMSEKAKRQDFMGIFSRLVKSVEIVAYDTPGNVKHTSLDERLRRCRALGLYNLMTSDYSSFEASHKKNVAEAVFRPFFNHVFQLLPKREQYVDLILHMLTVDRFYTIGRKCNPDNYLAAFDIEPIEQSGDPTTALLNLILNMIAYLDVYCEKGVPIEKTVELIILEGDDDVNDPLDLTFTKKDFAKRGLIAKIVPGLDLEQAGLCQMFFHPDVDVICPNPIKKLVSCFKIPMKYLHAGRRTHRSLLRMNAMSLLSMHAGAPVVHAMARAMMRITRGVNVMDEHWKNIGYHVVESAAKAVKWAEIESVTVDNRSRLMVERVFKLSVEMQLVLEDKLDNWNGGPLEFPDEIFPPIWREYYQDYTRPISQPALIAEPLTTEAELLQTWAESMMVAEEEMIEYRRGKRRDD
jgi:hypothetical protein